METVYIGNYNYLVICSWIIFNGEYLEDETFWSWAVGPSVDQPLHGYLAGMFSLTCYLEQPLIYRSAWCGLHSDGHGLLNS